MALGLGSQTRHSILDSDVSLMDPVSGVHNGYNATESGQGHPAEYLQVIFSVSL